MRGVMMTSDWLPSSQCGNGMISLSTNPTFHAPFALDLDLRVKLAVHWFLQAVERKYVSKPEVNR
jgi:hypothetical protein